MPSGTASQQCIIASKKQAATSLSKVVIKGKTKNGESPRRTIYNNTFFSPEYNFIETRSYKKRLEAALESSDHNNLPFHYRYQDPLTSKLKIDLSFFVQSLPPLDELDVMQCVLPLKTRSVPTYALVLDLDETLVHSTLTSNSDAEFTFKTTVDGQVYEVFVRTRPYLAQFIQRLAPKFELILFTASLKEYGDKLMDYLDPDRNIKHRLFRSSCRFVNNNYVKDLSILGRELSRIAIVDNSPQAFGYQISNGIPIKSWYGDKNDKELLKLLPFLESLLDCDDVRLPITSQFQLAKCVSKVLY